MIDRLRTKCAEDLKLKLLPLSECADRLGNKISTWRAWVLRRKVPYYKIGRSIRVAESDLLEIIEKARVPSREEE